MVRIFKGKKWDKLMPQRNWCAVLSKPLSAGGAATYALRCEAKTPWVPSEDGFWEFAMDVPPLKTAPLPDAGTEKFDEVLK